MIIKYIIRFILVIAVFSSCVSVGKVELEVLKPPRDTLEVEMKQISLRNGFLNNNQKAKSEFENLVKYDKYRIDSLISVEALRTVHQKIQNAGLVQINQFDSLGRAEKIKGPVVILKTVDVVSKVETDPVYVTSRNAYYAAVRVPYRLTWELRQHGKIIDHTEYSDTVWAEGYKQSFDKLADLVRFNDVITYIIDKTAGDYAMKITPTWNTQTRYFIRNGNNDFYRAAYLMDNKKYDEAAKIWKKYTRTGNKSIAATANLNLAVYYELKGNIEKAIQHAKTAAEKGNRLAENYLSILQNRKAEINQLLNHN